jgi:hypothetical protein
MVPTFIGGLSYLFVAPTDQKIFLIVAGQIVMTFLFDASAFKIILMLFAPVCFAFMALFRKMSIKPLNQFTLLLYPNLLAIPVVILLTLSMGKISGLVTSPLFL